MDQTLQEILAFLSAEHDASCYCDFCRERELELWHNMYIEEGGES